MRYRLEFVREHPEEDLDLPALIALGVNAAGAGARIGAAEAAAMAIERGCDIRPVIQIREVDPGELRLD